MNIFFLHLHPNKCSKYYSDKHVVKIILEITQLLVCAQYFNNNDDKPYNNCYKKTHINHPMSKWVRESYNNYLYTLRIGFQLCKEFRYRRNKIHACEYHLKKLKKIKRFDGFKIDWVDKVRLNINNNNLYDITPIPMCMPDECIKYDCAVKCYRNYYKTKGSINSWNWGRKQPRWYKIIK
jgi:hypothetical protein